MNKGRIDFVLLFVYAIFLHPVVPDSFSTICYLALYGFPLCYLLLHLYELDRLLGRIGLLPSVLVLCLGFLLLASMMVPVLLGTFDFSYVNVILAIARKLLVFLFLLLITALHCENRNCVKLFMHYYVLATCCYVASTCVFLALPSLKDAWIRFIGSNEYFDRLYASYGYGARFGWSGFSGYRETLDCSIAIVFAFVRSASDESGLDVGEFELNSSILVCFLGNLFYGRTGIIASAICIVIGLLFYRKIRVGQILGLAILVAGGYFAISSIRESVPIVQEWYDWATKPFINVLNTGSFNNYSVDHILNDMIYMPDVDTLIHGDGWYTEPVTNLHYMHTDVGFMRQILFWGAPMTLLTYFITVGSVFLLNEFDRVMPLLLTVIFVVFEIKGEVYFELIPLALVVFLVEKSISRAPKQIAEGENWPQIGTVTLGIR